MSHDTTVEETDGATVIYGISCSVSDKNVAEI